MENLQIPHLHKKIFSLSTSPNTFVFPSNRFLSFKINWIPLNQTFDQRVFCIFQVHMFLFFRWVIDWKTKTIKRYLNNGHIWNLTCIFPLEMQSPLNVTLCKFKEFSFKCQCYQLYNFSLQTCRSRLGKEEQFFKAKVGNTV